ncbi:FHA domain-containing protein [Streptomyces sp. DSM 42041]|uniref:FHA domain-containing protein n=1 Tax=Streptomyces hazeniae TaxID=3075538 RepID=A0ABU2NYN9_9ACTN|nr:FHA domain-containing protein [Streptomyces sp. DSM 42041]MDT0381637.1 FHA domain-containing protein [Streptomyces sp. DSM 42041]
MQIRLGVLASRGGQAAARATDVVVTAPSGTVLATIAEGLVAAAAGAPDGAERSERPERDRDRDRGHETVPVYVGERRLDPHRQIVGLPPLVDGAEVSLYAPSPAAHAEASGGARARLHVVAGPDAGGVHLLHGGRVTLGRSAEADVPLDDPDVSRLHCAVTVTDSGQLTVTDLESTNGTALDGSDVPSGRTVPLRAGATVRLGESAARVQTSDGDAVPLGTVPDGDGRLRLAQPAVPGADDGPGEPAPAPSPVAGPEPPGTLSAPPPSRAPGGGTAARRGPDPTPGPPGMSVADGHRTKPEGGTEVADRDAAPSGPSRPSAPSGRGLTGWARKWATWRAEAAPSLDARGGAAARRAPGPPEGGPAARDVTRPDLATVLLTALGPGPLLWERGPQHPHALTVRIGIAHRSHGPGEPVTVDLRTAGSLGMAGPRTRLAALARALLAQLTALHGPGALETVLIAADRARAETDRTRDWAWLGWLPHVRPAHGQDCRLLVAYDGDQAAARTSELVRRLDETASVSPAAYRGPRTVLVVDGDPGPAPVRDAVARLAAEGAAAGIHVLCLAETPSATPASPLDDTVRAAGEASPPFRSCGTFALLSGAVATAVRIVRPGRRHADGTVATMDGVSAAWAERFARALAPLREADGSPAGSGGTDLPRVPAALPRTCRLLDELGLARATPAALLSRWAASAAQPTRLPLTLGAGPRGPVAAALTTTHPHLLLTGPAGSGKTELLRAVAASLAADTPADRLALLLVDGDADRATAGGGLSGCADLPPAGDHLVAGDPVRMREFAQSLSAELKRRAELVADGRSSDGPPADATRVVSPRRPLGTAATARPAAPPLPRLVVLVDDFDTLVDPALGNPGRPSAGSVVRALEAVARDGARLGVHLIAASGRPDAVADTATARGAAFEVRLTGRDGDDPVPGRGSLRLPDGTSLPFQGGRVSGRIPRTATLRPTVVPLDWARAGDPPTRRTVRELGNGPTDLALLASAMTRAARPAAPSPSSV